MTDADRATLDAILVSQTLLLARQIKMEKAAHGVSSTSDYVHEAARLIHRQRPRVLEALRAAG